MKQGNFLDYKEHRIHYYRFGEGPRLLFALHGFADRARLFLSLEPSLKTRYTVISIDAPFHGLTEWNGRIFKPEDMACLLQLMAKTWGWQRFSLMAHSMGGRMIIGFLEKVANQVDELLLFAPAGFRRIPLYNKWLFPMPARRFFCWAAQRPGWILAILRLAHKLNLLRKASYDFFYTHLENERRRDRLLNIWLSLYYFPIGLKQFRNLIETSKIELHFFYGTQDRITLASAAREFAEDMQMARFYMVEDDHFLVDKMPLLLALSDWVSARAESPQK